MLIWLFFMILGLFFFFSSKDWLPYNKHVKMKRGKTEKKPERNGKKLRKQRRNGMMKLIMKKWYSLIVSFCCFFTKYASLHCQPFFDRLCMSQWLTSCNVTERRMSSHVDIFPQVMKEEFFRYFIDGAGVLSLLNAYYYWIWELA